MDHNATTPTDPRVVEAMLPYFSERYGNPSSPYELSQGTRRAVEGARETVAASMGCAPREIVFTSGGTESDNMALKGVAFANLERPGHMVTTGIEHHAVLHTATYLRDRFGLDVTFVGVDETGRVEPADVERACRQDTVLVSVMLANNEVGTVQPVREIAAIARERGIIVHTDAVQAIGKLPLDLGELGVDLLSMSSHKIYGPKGVGFLYVRRGVSFDPLSHGGSHEWSVRAGTENVPGIVGLARALELAVEGIPEESVRLSGLTARLENGILQSIPEVSINGHPTERLPGTLNVSLHYVEGESVVLALDMEGIAVSTGSACTTDSAEPSHVLSAMGVPANVAQGSVRFGLGRSTTQADVDRVLDVLPGVVERLRAISPLHHRKG
ncbi:cysteine desulfurase NifS [bacterium]|nr:cysteine desulfurase NifS [bacterium]